MDISSSELLSELEMEDIQGLMNQYEMSKLDFSVDNFSTVDSFSSENPSLKDLSFQTPARIENKNQKADDISNKSFSLAPKQEPMPVFLSSAFTISFGDPEPNPFRETKKTSIVGRNEVQAQDHVLAERKRRERLTHRFVSLSALLPNLKKMDKASVLEDATNYIKELQNRVKELEGLSETKRNDVQESLVSAKRSKLSGSNDLDASSFGETNSGEISSSSCKLSPEIEIQMSGSIVLVRIHCEKKSSSLVKALNEMEKIGLFIISSSAMPFANTTLLITIVAKTGDDFCMTETDLVKNLQLAV